MAQVAALLRPKVRESEITQTSKPKVAFVKLIDWSRIGLDDEHNVKFFKNSVTRDTVKVKVSLV
jgi:hypothetical protein